MPERLFGSLTSFCTSDPEAVIWLFVSDDFDSLDAAHLLEDGDMLTVFDHEGDIVFNGLIECDYGDGHLRAGGYAANWIQKGWKPEDWAGLFMTGKERPYRAELCKRTLH